MILGVIILGDPFNPCNLISLSIIFTAMIGYIREKEKLMKISS